ncbi:cytochrome C [Bizionia gelidisalsuginis]|uniref:Cytochrome C n=2 Tax=Bizionia TaxID=283785 RepID=A0A8H2LII7_9FLAO|nr:MULTISPECIES: heme-binding domain-containing protein [Bizionia]TYB77402.1 cytochrome C [Bizionia saleffrena]TYC17916.1 cytochrome C [Bizionia gelidisalsuginis]
MKLLKKILVALFILFIVAQFFRPEKNDGNLESVNAFLAETNPPENVKAILKESCFDCHTSASRYPWYNAITPVNYWLAEHINDGKKHLDLSNWEGNSVKRKDHKFEEIIEMVEQKEMPLPSYIWTHSEAQLSESQIQAVIDWANQVRLGYALAPRPE